MLRHVSRYIALVATLAAACGGNRPVTQVDAASSEDVAVIQAVLSHYALRGEFLGRIGPLPGQGRGLTKAEGLVTTTQFVIAVDKTTGIDSSRVPERPWSLRSDAGALFPAPRVAYQAAMAMRHRNLFNGPTRIPDVSLPNLKIRMVGGAPLSGGSDAFLRFSLPGYAGQAAVVHVDEYLFLRGSDISRGGGGRLVYPTKPETGGWRVRGADPTSIE